MIWWEEGIWMRNTLWLYGLVGGRGENDSVCGSSTYSLCEILSASEYIVPSHPEKRFSGKKNCWENFYHKIVSCAQIRFQEGVLFCINIHSLHYLSSSITMYDGLCIRRALKNLAGIYITICLLALFTTRYRNLHNLALRLQSQSHKSTSIKTRKWRFAH